MFYIANLKQIHTFACIAFFYLWGKKPPNLLHICKHASLIIPPEILPQAPKSQISHVLLLGGHRLLSINAPFVGGTWWISEWCSFHLLTAKIAWGCWRVPDKQGLLHASPWSTFSVAPWIYHGPWQHAPFWAYYIMVDDVAAAGGCWLWWWLWLWCSGFLQNG